MPASEDESRYAASREDLEDIEVEDGFKVSIQAMIRCCLSSTRTNCKRRRIGLPYGSAANLAVGIVRGVMQGSLLGPIDSNFTLP